MKGSDALFWWLFCCNRQPTVIKLLKLAHEGEGGPGKGECINLWTKKTWSPRNPTGNKVY